MDFKEAHDRACDTVAELNREVLSLRARVARLEGAIAEIDRCFCPMAISHPWVQAGLDSARKVLERDK